MNSCFTGLLVCEHRGFVVAKSNFKFIAGGTNILYIALVASNKINNVLRFTCDILSNLQTYDNKRTLFSANMGLWEHLTSDIY